MAPQDEPTILELRVHGVNNTPASNMLNFTPDDISQCDGDALGSFWSPKADAVTTALQAASRRWTRGTAGPGENEWIPPDFVHPSVRREAYSWGAQARYSGRVPGSGNPLVLRTAKAAWVLLIPLTVTNAAYWSRRLVPDVRRSLDDESSLDSRKHARGHRPILLFALGLTLLFVSALQTAALDVVGTQCFSDPSPCPNRPEWLNGLAEFSWGRRMVLLSAVPVLGLLLLRWVSASASVRPPPAAGPTLEERDSLPETRKPILAQPDLWRRWWLATRATRTHVAASVALTAGLLAWGGLFGSFQDCQDVSDLGSETCVQAMSEQKVFLGPLGLAIVVFIVSTVLLLVCGASNRGEYSRASSGDRWARYAGMLEAASWATLVAVLVALWCLHASAREQRLPGQSALPSALVGGLFLIGCIAMTWRHHWRRTAVATTAAAAMAVGLVGLAWSDRGQPFLWAVVGVGLVALCASALRWSSRGSSEAWLGTAPGVFLLLALGLQMLLCSTALVVLGDWLNGPNTAGSLFKTGPGLLSLPRAYALFMACAAFTIPLTGGFVVSVWIRRQRWLRRGPDEVPTPTEGVHAFADLRQRAASLSQLSDDDETREAIVKARRSADVLQRGESVVGGITVGLGLALAATILLMPEGRWFAATADRLILPSATAGTWIATALWAMMIVRVLTAKDTARPVGLLWDLACFLPRTAHPFGPPCYAERAVPEITTRVDAWLSGADLPNRSQQRVNRRVVLAPHSMGVVLAVAALMQPHRERWHGRVALLSYGTQLRPYFGRFFPELLGPGTIGNRAVACATFRRPTWDATDLNESPPAQADAVEPRLVDILEAEDPNNPSPLWISLWRRTDPLGMKVGLDEVDREAEELDGSRYLADVATHSDYPNSVAYRQALTELTQRLRPSSIPQVHPRRVTGASCIAIQENTAQVRATFLGTSSVYLNDGVSAVLVDGFFSRPSLLRVALGRVAPNAERIAQGLSRVGVGELQALLVAHSHYDHAMDAPEIIRRRGGMLYGSRSTLNVGLGCGLDDASATIISGGDVLTVGEFAIRVLEGPHSPGNRYPGTIDEPLVPPTRARNYRDGGCYSFHISHTTGTLLIHPSANFVPHIFDGLKADALYLGVGLLGTQSEHFRESYWRHVVDATQPSLIVPVHWDNFFRSLDRRPRPLPTFMDRFKVTEAWLERKSTESGIPVHFQQPFETISPLA